MVNNKLYYRSKDSKVGCENLKKKIFFLSTPMACRSSHARYQGQATAVTTLSHQPLGHQGTPGVWIFNWQSDLDV